MVQRVKAAFIEPMLLLRTDTLPDEPARWEYQLKLDGYRAIAFKTGGTVHLRSRNDNDFSAPVPGRRAGPREAAGRDRDRRRARRARRRRAAVVQRAAELRLVEHAGCLLRLRRDGARRPRRQARDARVRGASCSSGRSCRSSPSRCATSAPLEASLPDLIHSVKAQGLEGLVAKRRDSRYEPGLRSGAWLKMRINRGQEFVIGGYTRRHEDLRRADLRLLRRRPSDLRRAHPQRLHAGAARAAVQEVPSRWRSPSARSRTCRRRRAAGGGRD